MSSVGKLINKFLYRENITVEDCDRLLIYCSLLNTPTVRSWEVYYGYEYHKTGGSHRVYHQKGAKSITVVIPKKSKYVNTAYVDLVIQGLNLEGLHGNK
jgi:predicted RNA binding protein YcfA (HicA-like mRNA interferase family)